MGEAARQEGKKEGGGAEITEVAKLYVAGKAVKPCKCHK